MKNQPCVKPYTLNTSEGFTLIELLVVIAVIGILAVGGFVSFISYTQKVTLDNATSDVVNMLNTAKSRAQAQIKPQISPCNNNTFRGYRVNFIKNGNNIGNYNLNAVCDSIDRSDYCDSSTSVLSISTQKLPGSISFDNGSSFVTCVMFNSFSSLSTNRSIKINGNNGSKTINVDAAGNISF